jgi:hypothetical protein
MRMHKGSVLRQSAALESNWEDGHDQLWHDYFIVLNLCSRRLFSIDAFGCQGNFSCVAFTNCVSMMNASINLKKDATGKLG